MNFKVVAKQAGNSVEVYVDATDIKDALRQAREAAKDIFNYQPNDEMPTVSVKPAKED